MYNTVWREPKAGNNLAVEDFKSLRVKQLCCFSIFCWRTFYFIQFRRFQLPYTFVQDPFSFLGLSFHNYISIFHFLALRIYSIYSQYQAFNILLQVYSILVGMTAPCTPTIFLFPLSSFSTVYKFCVHIWRPSIYSLYVFICDKKILSGWLPSYLPGHW